MKGGETYIVLSCYTTGCATSKTFTRTYGLGKNKKQGWGKLYIVKLINFKTFFMFNEK
jgi:hypothetical protein